MGSCEMKIITALRNKGDLADYMTDLKDWVQKMRTYDVQILNAANLADPAVVTAALQLKQLAQDSYTGRTIPPNEGPSAALGSAGAYQAYIECQYLAALDFQKVS